MLFAGQLTKQAARKAQMVPITDRNVPAALRTIMGFAVAY